MLTREKNGVTMYAVWSAKFNPTEDEPITDDEICDATDTILNTRIRAPEK